MICIAFGITRVELAQWKSDVEQGKIAFLTHYWHDVRFPNYKTVTKVGCSNIDALIAWCKKFNLNPDYIHYRDRYPHFDLIGPYQYEVLKQLGLHEHILRFRLHKQRHEM